MHSELRWTYALAFTGIGFCSFVLFLVPSMKYDVFPWTLAIELWLATVVTSLGTFTLGNFIQNELDELIKL